MKKYRIFCVQLVFKNVKLNQQVEIDTDSLEDVRTRYKGLFKNQSYRVNLSYITF